MSQPFIRHSKVYTRKITCLINLRHYSSKPSSWFTRFLSLSEEKELYLGITSAFREKLNEQSSKSAKTYSNIIEHALLSSKSMPPKTGMLSAARIEQLKTDLDTAGKSKDIDKLERLETEMDSANLQIVTIYNRLIRAYIWNHAVDAAENVLNKFEDRGLVPTTRTFTYLVQGCLKQNQVEKAKALVNRMQDLGLLKLRNSFDYSIMFKYYEACGDAHAIEFLWRDISLHIDTIKPGTGLFTEYMEYLLTKQNTKTVDHISKNFLLQHCDQPLTLHQYSIWMKAVQTLAETHQKTAEQVLLYIIKNAPSKMSWDKPKHTIKQMVTAYLNGEQELKAIALYYKLRKMEVPDQAFDVEMTQAIDAAVKKIEDKTQTKAMVAELEGLIFAKV